MDCSDGPEPWYVARLKPNGLLRAKDNLSRQDFRTFMPVRETTGRRGSRFVRSTKPLFPGYLFVQIPSARQDWPAINSTRGVAGLVAIAGSAPTPLPAGFVETIASACCGTEWSPALKDLAIGMDVRVIGGPFASQVAKISSLPEQDRIFVVFDIMGRPVSTQIDRADLEFV